MNLISRRILFKLKRLSNFHRPQFRHLDCIDLVLENKLLLLLSWDAVHTYKIRIRPGRIAYRTSASAAVCQLPFGTESVDIIGSNYWRSSKVSFRLKQIALDEQTLQYLDKLFVKKIRFSKIQPEISIPAINILIPQPGILLSLRVPVQHISINQHQLNDYAP